MQGQGNGDGWGRIITHHKPDRGWAWVVTLSCCFINAIVFGIYRTYGILFVAVLKTYGVSRETAAWPFSLFLTIFHMTGLLSGALSSYFSTRSITALGCLIAAFGVTLCYFATSVFQITILIGVVEGFGVGLLGMQTPVIINQYFVRFRATASGIAFAGGTIGSFLFPPIVKIILFEYSLHGCFLILGGFMLNTLPVAMLLRPPTLGPKQGRKYPPDDMKPCLLPNNNGLITNGSVPCPLPAVLRSDLKGKAVVSSEPSVQKEANEALIDSARLKAEAAEKLAQTAELSELLNNKVRDLREEKEGEARRQLEYLETNGSLGIKRLRREPHKPSSSFSHSFLMALESNFRVISDLLRNPLFIILCVTHVSFMWGWSLYSMVLVDFAVDRGANLTDAVILLSAFAGSDLIGRLGSGWISDKGIIKRRNVAFVSILSMGILLWLTPIAANFQVLLGISVTLGLFCGSLVILFSVLLVEYVGIETMPVALGTSTFICGAATLFRPKAVGYFRDVHGSYDGLFRYLGVSCMMAALLWLVEPCAHLWQARKKRWETRGLRSKV